MKRTITVRATPLPDPALKRQVKRPENPFAPITEAEWVEVEWSPYYQQRLDAGELELQPTSAARKPKPRDKEQA